MRTRDLQSHVPNRKTRSNKTIGIFLFSEPEEQRHDTWVMMGMPCRALQGRTPRGDTPVDYSGQYCAVLYVEAVSSAVPGPGIGKGGGLLHV